MTYESAAVERHIGQIVQQTDRRESTSMFLYLPHIDRPSLPDWTLEIRRSLRRMRKLSDRWNADNTEPPNTRSLFYAERIIDLLVDLNLKPHKIVPSAEGGIAITFRKAAKYADIECFNSGEIVAIMADGISESEVWEVSLDRIGQTLDIIYGFINKQPTAKNVSSGATSGKYFRAGRIALP